MNYFSARKTESLFKDIKKAAEKYWNVSPTDHRTNSDIASGIRRRETEESARLREQIAQMIPEAETLANEMGRNVICRSPWPLDSNMPAPPVNMLRAIIDPICGCGAVPRDNILDTLNLCIGSAQAIRRRAKWQTFNPVYWAIGIVAFFVRIPFLILRQAGLPAKVEENIISHIIKVASMTALLFLLVYLGWEKHINSILWVLGR